MELRWYQNEAIEDTFKYFGQHKDPKENPLIALPTGTGKSPVQGGFIKRVIENWPYQRFLCLTHVKELVDQNAKTLRRMMPNAPIGIHSAGLKQRDFSQPVIFGGAGSVVKNIDMFGHRDICFVDECHMIGGTDTKTYHGIINGLRKNNPKIRFVGLTATPYRMKQGMITDGGDPFTHISYDMTGLHEFNRLLAEGFLCPLVAQPTHVTYDVSKVGITGGEFSKSALQDAVDNDLLNRACVEEMVERASTRNCWLVFASGIEHAEHIAEMLQAYGIDALAVHSKLEPKERDRRIALFKSGGVRCLVNNGVLTTGFDHPPVDFIGMMRPTLSPGLWVQMLGRGTRPYDWWIENLYRKGFDYTKYNCLVLDFAGNTVRLGPINDPKVPRKKGAGGGDMPIRVCDNCGTYNHASARFCGGSPKPSFAGCGFEFTFESKLEETSGTAPLIAEYEAPTVAYFDVRKVLYNLHRKEGAKDSMKVSYYCGERKPFDVWIALESDRGKHLASQWWKQADGDNVPATTIEALERAPYIRTPRRIRVQTNLSYPKVLNYEYE